MNDCDLCHEPNATQEFCGKHYHRLCYVKICEIIQNELKKKSDEQ